MYTSPLHVVNRRLYGIYINVWFTNNLWKAIWLLDSISFTSLCQALFCAIPNSCPPLTWRQLLLGGSSKHTRVELTPPAAVIWWVLCLKKGTAWQLLLCRQASMWWQVVQHCRDEAQVKLSGERVTQIHGRRVKFLSSREIWWDLKIHTCGKMFLALRVLIFWSRNNKAERLSKQI